MSLGEPTVSSGTFASLSLQESLTLLIFLFYHILPVPHSRAWSLLTIFLP